MSLTIRQIVSPNFSPRHTDTPIDMVIIHYTGMRTANDALKRLCNKETEVSSHYLIDIDGRLDQLVDEKDCAWHAGVSSWHDRTSLNQYSIGIELVNPGHDYGYLSFPEVQMNTLMELLHQLTSRYTIKHSMILGHSDIAPNRKADPGELFDWRGLAIQGYGLWPNIEVLLTDNVLLFQENTDSELLLSLQKKLQSIGYHIPATGIYDKQSFDIITAFKRRYCPEFVDGHWQALAEKRLNALLTLLANEDEIINSH
jgi:N-acetylmuramoyl-L-alanine amidase